MEVIKDLQRCLGGAHLEVTGSYDSVDNRHRIKLKERGDESIYTSIEGEDERGVDEIPEIAQLTMSYGGYWKQSLHR